MGKIKQSRKQPPEKRRQQLLRSAGKLFARKGYRGTTTEEIARHAGLTKGALYHHFKSKEDVLFAIVKDNQDCFETIMSKLGDKGPLSPLAIMRGIIDAHQDVNQADFRQMIDVWVQAMRIPRISRFVNERYNRVIEWFCKTVDPAYAKTPAARRHLAVMVFALVDGLMVHQVWHSGAVKHSRQYQLMEQFQDVLKQSNLATGGTGCAASCQER
jgi:AcrR family transcriptional regulator